MKYPQAFKTLIESFESLPGVGPKTAERLAFFVIEKRNQEQSLKLSDSIRDAINDIKECSVCGMLSDNDVCEVCADGDRENKLMIVENSKDVISFEKTQAYHGKYHVLKGLISPTNGKGPDDLNFTSLIARVKSENFSEVIIATSSSVDGELTALYLKKI